MILLTRFLLLGLLMLVDSLKKVVVTILEKQTVCLQHEITDRAWSNFRRKFPSFDKAIYELFLEKTIDVRMKESPYGKPFHFYFLSTKDVNEVNRIINYKLDLLWKHSKLTEEVGRLGEMLVGNIVKDLGYSEVEIRKEKHGDIGFKRMDLDVWGKHPKDYYQIIEVKNRRQPVNVSDIEEIIAKNALAQELWKLPVKSALVCAFIYRTAQKKANSANIPIVMTKKVFVPKEYEEFYKEYKSVLGSYYMEAVSLVAPPYHFRDLIKNFIFNYKYDK